MNDDEFTALPVDDAGPDAALHRFEDALRERFSSRDALIAEAREQIARRARRTRAARRAAIGSSVAGVLLAAVVWLDPAWSTQEWRTAVGERRDVQLADSSHLLLDSASVVRVGQHLRSRRITLERGEVLVTVAPARRPLVVQADGARVRDIGTVFSVRLDPGSADVLTGGLRSGSPGVLPSGLQVTVLQGAVAVDAETGPASRGAPMQVPAGHTLRLVRQAAAAGEPGWLRGTPVAANVEQLLAWRRGRLEFDGTPLAQAVAQLQRYRAAPIRLLDQRIAGLRLSGDADVADIDALLEQLPAMLPVAVQRAADGSVAIRAR